MADNDVPRVVVGVDVSEPGAVALRYALQEAARRGARIVAVSVWDPPIRTLTESFGLAAYDSTKMDAVHERIARERIDDVVAQQPGAVNVPLEVQARTGRAADILVEAAQDADLLVVGHRSHGSLLRGVLGSVGLSCVLHAPCPVLVVPPASSSDTPEPGREPAATAP
jgi:nucleotide-binding universal stress UspA family protein